MTELRMYSYSKDDRNFWNLAVKRKLLPRSGSSLEEDEPNP